jgi:energy coupling factor transporter S component ThiW
MMACLAFVLNTFVYFPAMAPFQHFVDVVAAVFLGPWYACAAAFLCGIMRMMSGRTIQAVTGAVFGPLLGGLLCKKGVAVVVGMLNSDTIGGTQFLGIKKPVIKAHGSSGVTAFRNAIRQAEEAAERNFAAELEAELEKMKEISND